MSPIENEMLTNQMKSTQLPIFRNTAVAMVEPDVVNKRDSPELVRVHSLKLK